MKMLQVVLERPGRLVATDAPAPSPGPGDALVRVHRVGICGTDLHAVEGRQPFFTYPRIIGHELGVEVIPGSAARIPISRVRRETEYARTP
jgi:threonine dehydrogenase-like Zn-dependent dehydrogenase